MSDATQIAPEVEQPVPQALSVDAGPEGEEGPEDLPGDIDPQEAIDRFGLATAEAEAAAKAAEVPERVSTDDILDKMRLKLFQSIDAMDPDKVLRLYEATLKHEELLLRRAMKGKPPASVDELRRKAARAFSGSAASPDE